MSGEAYSQSLNPIGPRQGQVRAIACGTAAANVDISGLAEFLFGVGSNQIISLTAEGGDVWYCFSDTNATPIDRTDTTAGHAQQCDYLPVGASRDVHVPWAKGTGGNSGVLCKFLHYQAAIASGVILRISVSSEALNARI